MKAWVSIQNSCQCWLKMANKWQSRIDRWLSYQWLTIDIMFSDWLEKIFWLIDSSHINYAPTCHLVTYHWTISKNACNAWSTIDIVCFPIDWRNYFDWMILLISITPLNVNLWPTIELCRKMLLMFDLTINNTFFDWLEKLFWLIDSSHINYAPTCHLVTYHWTM